MKKRLSIILTAVVAILMSVALLGTSVKAASADDDMSAQGVEFGSSIVDAVGSGQYTWDDILVNYYGFSEEDAAAAATSWDEMMGKLVTYQGIDADKSNASLDASANGTINITVIGDNSRTGTVAFTLESGAPTALTCSAEDTLAEAVEKAGLNTIIGLCMAFGVLTLIAIIIWLVFPQINKWSAENEKKKKAAAAPKAAPKAAPAAAPVVEEEEEDEGELIAVIAAAIAASEGKTSTDGFVVRSIRRHF